ncbi:MAG: alpha/beta hydrolase [Flavobacterium sp.]|nr:MAG: alpha/beta hydrolase [Flavobacterium sp.]
MKTLHYKNITVGYSDTGKGAALVLLHGFLENRTMWNDLLPELSKRNRIICIDLLGHGQTEPLGYVHSMEDNADLLHFVLSELRIRKCIIGGHSMGGYVALAFAELYPEYLKGLMLINSTSKADSSERKSNRDRAIKAVKADYTAFVRMSIANLFSEENRTRLASKIEEVRREALKTPLQGIVASLEGMKIRSDREILLHNSKFPVLLVLGKKDPVLSFDESVQQAENDNVELVIYDDGHMSPIENRDDLVKEIGNFGRKIQGSMPSRR